MAVELIRKELSVPRNIDEIRVLLVGLLEDVMAKKDVSAIVAENLQPLMAALEGMEKLGEEAKSPEMYNSVALLAGDLVRIFTAKAAPAPEVPPAA